MKNGLLTISSEGLHCITRMPSPLIFEFQEFQLARKSAPGGCRSGKHIAIGARDLGFDSRSSQIEHSVANGSPPL